MISKANPNGIQVLFDQFCKRSNSSKTSRRTLSIYLQSFKAFNLSLPLTQAQLNSEIVRMRQEGKNPNGINAYIRRLRPFLRFLFENGHLRESLKLKELKCEEKQMRTFSDHIRAILSYKPKTQSEHRLLALLTLLTDTGVRINEALTLTRGSIDFENLLLDVKGKGSKVTTKNSTTCLWRLCLVKTECELHD